VSVAAILSLAAKYVISVFPQLITGRQSSIL
jgi:hypothetical protein